jgi:hypothetical protein
VQSALAAKRSNVVVESIWEYGEGLFADASLDRAEVRSALQQMLQVLNRQTGADAGRAGEVRRRLEEDIRTLGTSAAGAPQGAEEPSEASQRADDPAGAPQGAQEPTQ